MMTPKELLETVPDPKIIVSKLNEYIIGQEAAKKTLAIMVLNKALSRLANHGLIPNANKIPSSNVLLIGPTGCGKTAMIRALSGIIDAPISISDITSVTAAGYIGGKVEDILTNHVNECDRWVEENYERICVENECGYMTRESMIAEYVENGIVYIDEIDKICKREEGKDVNGDMVQNELLKILEDGHINLSSSKEHTRCGMRDVDTSGITFICGGSFSGLTEIIERRITKDSSIGFSANINPRFSEIDKASLLSQVTTHDLLDYGFKFEFLGRIPLRSYLSPLDVPLLERIIVEPHDSLLKQYEELFLSFGIHLEMDKSAISAIAEKAVALKMGARSLRQIFNDLFMDYLFNIFSYKKKKLVISRKDIA